MRIFIPVFTFIFLFSFQSHAQDENVNAKGRPVWNGRGFFHFGIRPGNWSIDRFAAIPTTFNGNDTIYNMGAKGHPAPVYLAVEQISRFFYWNFDVSASGNKKYDYTTDQTGNFYNLPPGAAKARAITASLVASGGYLLGGRWGLYFGGRIGYDNVLMGFYSTQLPNGGTLDQLGGLKKGYNFHLFFPFIHGLFRISFYNDFLKNKDYNLKAKTKETEFSYFIPLGREKNFGIMLKYNHMAYGTNQYLSEFQSDNHSQEINFKRSYFQIGIVFTDNKK